jgi:hypothetical protein
MFFSCEACGARLALADVGAHAAVCAAAAPPHAPHAPPEDDDDDDDSVIDLTVRGPFSRALVCARVC